MENLNLEELKDTPFETVTEEVKEPVSLLQGEPTFGFDNNLIANSEETDVEKMERRKAEMEKARAEEEFRIKELAKPEVQARIVTENYVQNSPIRVNSRERKHIYNQCLKLAKKGKYKAYFIPEFIAKREARERAKLALLNQSPMAKTVDDMTPEMKEHLLEMANAPESEVPKFG